MVRAFGLPVVDGEAEAGNSGRFGTERKRQSFVVCSAHHYARLLSVLDSLITLPGVSSLQLGTVVGAAAFSSDPNRRRETPRHLPKLAILP